MSAPLNSYTVKLTPEQATTLRVYLRDHDFIFRRLGAPHVEFPVGENSGNALEMGIEAVTHEGMIQLSAEAGVGNPKCECQKRYNRNLEKPYFVLHLGTRLQLLIG